MKGCLSVGADKSSTNFVPIEDRIENHKSWLKIYLELTNKNFKVTGIALTGWSRYVLNYVTLDILCLFFD